jgi:purine-nucleoside phosphorylase
MTRIIKCFLACFIVSFSLHSVSGDYYGMVRDAASYLKNKTKSSPKLMIVLTCGVNGPEDLLEDKIEISSKDIPFFPTAKAQGHQGKLIFGKLLGKDVVLLKGRYHYYEGISSQDVVFPYFVLNQMGVDSVIAVNAAGGINYNFNVGDIMLVKDHINAMCINPLRGLSILKPTNQFTDMTMPYYLPYRNIAIDEASKLKIDLKHGVYGATYGPSYETKSEIRMFRSWGIDAIGMSTVLEVIACNYLNMRVLFLSCITNPAADRHSGNMDHSEVIEALNKSGKKVSDLVTQCAKKIVLEN